MDGIIETLKRVSGTKTFINLLESADQAERLNTEGPFTIFVPNDEAFAELPTEMKKSLLSDTGSLIDFLNYHFLLGDYSEADLAEQTLLETTKGEILEIDLYDDTLTLNDSAAVIKPDIGFNDGVIHIIDTVLLPV